jgi:hypothetical protein
MAVAVVVIMKVNKEALAQQTITVLILPEGYLHRDAILLRLRLIGRMSPLSLQVVIPHKTRFNYVDNEQGNDFNHYPVHI